MPRCSSIVKFCNMNTILFSYRFNWMALFIRASDLFCVFGCPCILGSTMKIPIASLDVWLRPLLAAQANMLMITLLQRFVPFHLNPPGITLLIFKLLYEYINSKFYFYAEMLVIPFLLLFIYLFTKFESLNCEI